jgi:hypothetical protein
MVMPVIPQEKAAHGRLLDWYMCHDSNPKEGRPLMMLVITQIDLTDDHWYVSRDKGESKVHEASKEAPTVHTRSLKVENVPMENDKTRVETWNHDANLEIPDVAKSPEKSKQIDYKHAFISIKRRPSASPRKRMVSL